MARTSSLRFPSIISLLIVLSAAIAACGSSSRPAGAPGSSKLLVAGDPSLEAACAASVTPDGVFRGSVYHVPLTTQRIPDFESLAPVASICDTKIAVTARQGFQGFPGVTERFEWFAVDYRGTFTVNSPGEYRFRLTSDDGAALYIDGVSLINQDGLHGAMQSEIQLNLKDGPHKIRVSYFQGPGELALILETAIPNEPFEVFHADRPLGRKIDPLPASTIIEGAKFTSSTGSASKEQMTANDLPCPGSGCGALYSVGASLDYVFATEPNKRYTAGFNIADYQHNCAETIAASFFANGDRVTTFRGAGVNGWTLATFDFTAAGKTTTLRVTEDNDACCGCTNTCNPACQPLFKDLNLYVVSVKISDAF